MGTASPLSEYPKIPRYSDHPRTVHGWAQAHCWTPPPPCQSIPRFRDTQDSTWMGTSALHPPVRLSRDPLTIPGQYTNGHMHNTSPCQSIPRSQDTLTIPGRYTCPYLVSYHTSTMKQNYCLLRFLACLTTPCIPVYSIYSHSSCQYSYYPLYSRCTCSGCTSCLSL